jgi:hypothetical protein
MFSSSSGPWGLLLSQYEVDDQSRRVLAAAATNGVVTGVRRRISFQGRTMTLLALLSSVSPASLPASPPARPTLTKPEAGCSLEQLDLTLNLLPT